MNVEWMTVNIVVHFISSKMRRNIVLKITFVIYLDTFVSMIIRKDAIFVKGI